MSGKQLSVGDVARFVFAGNATVTVVRPARTKKIVREIAGVEVACEQEVPAARYTFKIVRAKGEDAGRPWFAKVLTGQNNETDYSVLSTLFPSEEGPSYRHNYNKSPIGADAPSARCLEWLVSKLAALGSLERRALESKLAGDMFQPEGLGDAVADVLDDLNKIEVWHEGRCGRCGRKLTVPKSIENGIGPECAEKVGALC